MNSFIYNNNNNIIFTRDLSQGVEFNKATLLNIINIYFTTLVQNMALHKKNRQYNDKSGSFINCLKVFFYFLCHLRL